MTVRPDDGEAVVGPDGVEAGQDQPEELEQRVEDLSDRLEQGVLAEQRSRTQHRLRRPSMDVDSERDEVHAVRPEGPTAEQAPRRQGEAAPEAVHGEGLDRVVRAARVEPAGGNPARGRALVGREQRRSATRDGKARRRSSAFFMTIPAARSRRPAQGAAMYGPHELRRARSVAARGLEPERGRCPGKRRGDSLGPTSRPGAGGEFRTTALPQWRPIAYPTWGNTPVAPVVGRHEEARTGPRSPARPGALQSAKAARAGDSSDRPGRHRALRR